MDRKRIEELKKCKAKAKSGRLRPLGGRRTLTSPNAASSSARPGPNASAARRRIAPNASAARRPTAPRMGGPRAPLNSRTAVAPRRQLRTGVYHERKKKPRSVAPNAQVAFTASISSTKIKKGGWGKTEAKVVKRTIGKSKFKRSSEGEMSKQHYFDTEPEIEDDGEYVESEYPPVVLPMLDSDEEVKAGDDAKAGEVPSGDLAKAKRTRKRAIVESDDEMEEEEKQETAEAKGKMDIDDKSADVKPDSSGTQIGTQSLAERLSAVYLESKKSKKQMKEIFFIQMPTALPVSPPKPAPVNQEGGDEKITVKKEPGTEVKQGTLKRACAQWEARQQKLYQDQLSAFNEKTDDSLTSLPDDASGVLQIQKSGKIRLKLGNVYLQMMEGAECAFHQNLFSVDTGNGNAYELGDVEPKRIVCSLDIGDLLS